MRKSRIVTATLGALGMAVVYDKIKQATGVEITALLWIGILVLIFGLFTGLYARNKTTTKEEV